VIDDGAVRLLLVGLSELAPDVDVTWRRFRVLVGAGGPLLMLPRGGRGSIELGGGGIGYGWYRGTEEVGGNGIFADVFG
jgi:hypothetical protein